jgi:hypothetical protein
MLESPIPNNQVVTVLVAQTTFAVLTMPGKQYRVDFLDKAEAYFKPGMRGKFSICSEHPLLLNYNSSLVGVYVNSRLPDPENLFSEIQRRIEAAFHGWRDWRRVLNGGKRFGADLLRKNLLDGSGLILADAPASIAKTVLEACRDYGVSTYIEGNPDAKPVKSLHHLLLIGEGYVIARDFRFTEMLTKAPPQSGQ